MIEVVKFSRKTCGPCRILTTFFREIDLAKLGATLTEVDIDESPAAIPEYKLGSVPTVVIKRNGLEVTRFVGLRGTDEIVDAIEHAKEVR